MILKIMPHALSGILINDISDHKMVFTFQENNKYHEEYSRFVEIEKRDEMSIQKFITELKIKIFQTI